MADKVIRGIVKTLLYIFLVLLFVYIFVSARKVGYLVFADLPLDGPEYAKESILTVEEGEKLLDITKDMEKMGIINNAYVCAMSFRSLEGYKEIRPGEYVLKSSQKPSEILDILIHKEEKEE